MRGLNDGKSDVSRALAGVQGEFSGVTESAVGLSASVDGGRSVQSGLGFNQSVTVARDMDPIIFGQKTARSLMGTLAIAGVS